VGQPAKGCLLIRVIAVRTQTFDCKFRIEGTDSGMGAPESRRTPRNVHARMSGSVESAMVVWTVERYAHG